MKQYKTNGFCSLLILYSMGRSIVFSRFWMIFLVYSSRYFSDNFENPKIAPSDNSYWKYKKYKWKEN